MSNRKQAVTLVELLVVVAILSVLTLIAVPNFADAQIRAKVSRVKLDFTTMRTAIHAYAVDHNHYPGMTLGMSLGFDDTYPVSDGVSEPIVGTLGPWITTPIAYLTQFELKDPFTWPVHNIRYDARIYTYHREGDIIAHYREYHQIPPEVTDADLLMAFYATRWRGYILWSFGPSVFLSSQLPGNAFRVPYDPTNGTLSFGGIIHYGEG